jgi:hypothetical protein
MSSSPRASNIRARDVALPTVAASSRIRRIRSSGANGSPLTMPISVRWPTISGSAAPTASSWSSAWTVSKKPASDGGMVLNVRPLPSTNAVSGTSVGGAGSPMVPWRRVATLVPGPVGV